MNDIAPRVGHTPSDDPYDAPDLQPSGVAPATVLEGLLDGLEKAITDEVDFEPVTLEVTKRPGVAVRYKTFIDDDTISRWRKQAENKRFAGGFDNMRFCLLVVATQCEAILMNGQDARDEAGQLITFGHKWTRDKMKVDRAADAARKLIANDAHVMLHANAVLDKAGYGDDTVEIDEEGPTQ